MGFDAEELSRRGLLAATALLNSGVLVSVGGLLVPSTATAQSAKSRKPRTGRHQEEQAGEQGEEGVSATEDLMREHGVLRRTLIVCAETARKLQSDKDGIDPSALVDAARLFRSFGEDYHERILEEQYIFPEVRNAGGPVANLVEVLLRQHQVGRDTTDYIERIGNKGKSAPAMLNRWRRRWNRWYACILLTPPGRIRWCFQHGRKSNPKNG